MTPQNCYYQAQRVGDRLFMISLRRFRSFCKSCAGPVLAGAQLPQDGWKWLLICYQNVGCSMTILQWKKIWKAKILSVQPSLQRKTYFTKFATALQLKQKNWNALPYCPKLCNSNCFLLDWFTQLHVSLSKQCSPYFRQNLLLSSSPCTKSAWA